MTTLSATLEAPGDTPTEPIRVALLNDFEVVVVGLAQMFEPYRDRLEIVELDVKADVATPVDIALFDTFGQTSDTLTAADVLSNPAVRRAVVYTWNLHPELIEQTRRQGVDGYLAKSLTADEMVIALERIHAGEVVVSPVDPQAWADIAASGDVEAVLATRIDTSGPEAADSGISVESAQQPRSPAGEGDWPGRNAGLSMREAEVITWITAGLTNQEIAERSYLSPNSVKSYIRAAYRKIGVTRRSQAVLWGIDHGCRPDEVVRRTPPSAAT